MQPSHTTSSKSTPKIDLDRGYLITPRSLTDPEPSAGRFLKSWQKVLRFLIDQARFAEGHSLNRGQVRTTRAAIARGCQLSPPTVTRALATMRTAGILETSQGQHHQLITLLTYGRTQKIAHYGKPRQTTLDHPGDHPGDHPEKSHDPRPAQLDQVMHSPLDHPHDHPDDHPEPCIKGVNVRNIRDGGASRARLQPDLSNRLQTWFLTEAPPLIRKARLEPDVLGWRGTEIARALARLVHHYGHTDQTIIETLTWLWTSDSEPGRFWRSRTLSAGALYNGARPGKPTRFDQIAQACRSQARR